MSTKKPNRDIPNSVSLRERLKAKEEEFHGKDDLFGITLLSHPSYISSSRNIMFTSHTKQFVNLDNPEPPGVFTNYENVFGRHSSGYVRAKSDQTVHKIIPRFTYDGLNQHLYLMFAYDEENDKYYVYEKKNVENLQEKYGFPYNTTNMDSKSVGSPIVKDEVIIKSSSYDDEMNYMYGRNVKYMYAALNETIEDAVLVSRSLANTMTSKEIEVVTINLNDNDILLNLYGDKTNYQGFPNIGESVREGVLAATRRIHNDQVLYDLKQSNLRRYNPITDTLHFIEGTVTDVVVYSNKDREDIKVNSFNGQLISYLDEQTRFYEEVLKTCEDIIESGSDYTKDINFWYRKAMEILSDEYRWKEPRAQMFSNMIVEITIERTVGLSEGQKLTGRMGNKGVISRILEDDEMPHLETGERVDLIIDSLGVVNRLNSQQLFEQSITFITNRLRERLATMKSLEERFDLFINVMTYLNSNQAKELEKYYMGLSHNQKVEFFDSIQEDRIYVHVPPMWEESPIFDRLRALYKEHTWIKKYDVYINQFGRRIKIMRPLVIGDMYIIKMKQSSKKGMSVRSTGSINRKGTPAKSQKAKIHQEPYSKTPIRMGDQENINTIIGIRPEIMAKLHLFYRSSVVGRRTMAETMLTKDGIVEEFEYNNHFYNRNVEILHAYLKSLGLRIVDDEDFIEVKGYDNMIRTRKLNNELYISSDEDFDRTQAMNEVMRIFEEGESAFAGTAEAYEEEVNRMVEFELAKNKSIWINATEEE